MYPLGCYCWSCFHLRKFQEFNSPRALNPLIQKKKKRDRVVVSPGEFLPLRFDETPTRAVRLRGVLLFLFLRGALFEWKNRGVSWFVVFFALKRGRLDSRKNAFIFFFLWKMMFFRKNKTRVESDQPDKRFLVEKNFVGRKYFWVEHIFRQKFFFRWKHFCFKKILLF